MAILPAFQLVILIIISRHCQAICCGAPFAYSHANGFQLTEGRKLRRKVEHKNQITLITGPSRHDGWKIRRRATTEFYSPTMPCLVFLWARRTVPDKRQRSPR